MAYRIRVLLTGFSPFGKYVENSSLTTAQQVVAQGVQGVELFLRMLPVSFERVASALHEAVEETHPDLIVMLGQAALSEKMRLERIAINLMDAKSADNDGMVPDEAPIYPNEPAALFTKLPIKKLCAFMVEQGLPVVVSNSCGLFVCNRLYYEALRLCEHTPNMKAIFVHLPLFKGQTDAPDGAGVKLLEMARVVQEVIGWELQ